jgi:hypothetical protein
MKNVMIVAGLITIVAVGVLTFGCSDDHDVTTTNTDQSAAILRVTPEDGTSDVPVTTSITVSFSEPMDMMSVMQSIYLAGGTEMQLWRDSLNHYGGFPMMSANMQEHMIDWMDSIHVTGEFHWNDAADSCEFIPESDLMHHTDYLLLLYEGGMRDHHDGMMGGGDHGDGSYHIYGFSTAMGGN